MSGIQLLLSDARGVFIPRDFCDSFDWSGMNIEDLEICSRGPDEDMYWEAWESITNDAFHIDKDGNTWTLWQDGDLWAVCEPLMTNEEYANFFGEERENAA